MVYLTQKEFAHEMGCYQLFERFFGASWSGTPHESRPDSLEMQTRTREACRDSGLKWSRSQASGKLRSCSYF